MQNAFNFDQNPVTGYAYDGINLLDSFGLLQQHLHTLTGCLLNDEKKGYPLALIPPALYPDASDRETLIRILNQITYLDEQDARTTLLCPGVVAASRDTLNAVRMVNEAKQAVQDAVVMIKKNYPADSDQLIKEVEQALANTRPVAIKKALRRARLSRLCLRQVYRKIHIAGDHNGQAEQHPPLRLAWSMRLKPPVTCTTARDAIAKLTRGLSEHAGNERLIEKIEDWVAQTPAGLDTPMAYQADPYYSLIANITLAVKNREGQPVLNKHKRVMRINKQRSGSLPIFYFSDNPKADLVKHKDLSTLDFAPVEEEGRKKRSDQTLESEPFIKEIHLYRYIS